MPEFTGPNWFSDRIPLWASIFEKLGMVGKPDLRFLEVGCCEGRATVWLLENVLTDPTSTIDVIDTFEGSPEFAFLAPEMDTAGMFARLQANIDPWGDQVGVWRGGSLYWLREDVWDDEAFDFVYLDGSHDAPDVLTDAVLAWPLLKPGGLLLFDDARWVQQLPDGRILKPRTGINAFMSAFVGQYDVLLDDVQLGLVKR